MVGWIIIAVLVVLALAALLYGDSHRSRGRDRRGGFEEHPGPDRMGPWG